MPFKHHAEHRHHIPKPRYRVTNGPEYDAALRRRGSLTVWFTDEAIAAWRAEPRTTPGGQPHYSALAITTALTMRAVFGLALRQTEGLIGSVIDLLGFALAVPDLSTLSRRSKTLEVPPLRRSGTGPLHLLVDSTGLKLGGAGEWLVEKHGTSRRRSWRKLHLGVDAESGEIVAIELTKKEIDDAARSGALLDQITDPIASFTADGELPPWEWRDEIGALRSESSDPFHDHPCLGGRSVTDAGMQTLPVIEHLDVIEHGRFGCLAGGEPAVMNMLDLERGKHALHGCIVQAVATAAHGLKEAVTLQHGPIRLRSILHAAIAVMDQTRCWGMTLQSHDQGVDA